MRVPGVLLEKNGFYACLDENGKQLAVTSLKVKVAEKTWAGGPISVVFKKLKSWSAEDKGVKGHIYSYHIELQAKDSDIHHWKVSFGRLPTGTKIYNSDFWPKVTLNGSRGVIEFRTPETGGVHVVTAKEKLPIDIQIFYPGEASSKYDQLYDLNAYQLDIKDNCI